MNIIIIMLIINLIAFIAIQDILGRFFKDISITPSISLMAFFGFTQLIHYPFLILNTPFKYINVIQMGIYFALGLYFVLFPKRSITRFIQSYSFNHWLILIIGFAFLMYSYTFIRFQLRTDDLNVYVLYMDQRVYADQSFWLSYQYDYQAFYSWMSASWYIYQRFASFSFYEDILPLGFMAWYPSIVLFYFLNTVLMDVYIFIKKFIQSRWLIWSHTLSVIYTFSLFWYLGFPSYGNQFRRLAVVVILLVLTENFSLIKARLEWLLGLLFFSLIAFSATGLFLSGMILYSLVFIYPHFSIPNYIRKLVILSPAFVIFSLLYSFKIGSVISIIYFGALLLLLFKKSNMIESLWNQIYKYAFITVPIIMVIGGLLFPSLVSYDVFENFFSNPDLEMLVDYLSFDVYNLESLSLVLVNIVIWVGLVSMIKKYMQRNENLSFLSYFLLVIFITFFNPFVMKFVMTNLTALAYFRIYDLIINPLTISLLIISLVGFKSRWIKIFSIILIGFIFLAGIRYSRIWTYVDTTSNLSLLYHVSDEEYLAINRLNEFITDEDKVDGIQVIAQIYGHHLLTNMDLSFRNLFRVDMVEDFYEKTDLQSKLSQIFLIKDHFLESQINDYSQLCKVTKEANIDFVIIESQYNWDIEYELGFCAEWIYTEGSYRVYRMRYDWLD